MTNNKPIIKLNIKKSLIILSFWVLGSFLIATFFTDLFVYSDVLNFKSSDIEVSSDAISNIFTAIFSTLAGAGSIIITLMMYSQSQYEKEEVRKKRKEAEYAEKMENDGNLEPITIQKLLLTNNTSKSTSFFPKKNSYLFRKDNWVGELFLIKEEPGFQRLFFNISPEKGKSTIIFVVQNTGNKKVIPLSIIILYRKKDVSGTNSKNQKYIKKKPDEEGEFYFIEETEEFGTIESRDHNPNPIFILATKKGEDENENNTAEHYEDFFNVIEKTLKFIVIVTYKSTITTKKTTKKAYEASLKLDNDCLFIENFTPLNKDYIEANIAIDTIGTIDST